MQVSEEVERLNNYLMWNIDAGLIKKHHIKHKARR